MADDFFEPSQEPEDRRTARRPPSKYGESKSRGSFTLNGGWNPHADVESESETHIRILIRTREASNLSPADLAAVIDERYALAFPNRYLWVAFDSYDDWPLVPTSSSAEEAVKRSGRGALQGAGWRAGRWVAT